jgi:energy-coupling factor transport system ATP-binding protein
LPCASSGEISVQSLTVRYPDRERPALDSVSERIRPGETVVVTGASGSGKTTLFRVLGGFVPSMIRAKVEGEVLIDGISILTKDSPRPAAGVGLVQQDPDAQICTLSVWEEVAFGPENLCLPPEEVTARVAESLASLGIAHLAGRETTRLSGGEKQRVAIASILALRPRVILLDEPTANLDPGGAKQVFDLLRSLGERDGRTLVLAEHRLAPLLPLHPRLLLLEEGKVLLRRPSVAYSDLDSLGLRARWEIPRPVVVRSGPPALVLEGVSFAYGEAPLLDRLTLRLWPGEVLGVIGPNGSGKTTLLRLAAGLERPQAGRVLRPKSPVLGFVFQHPHQQIFERTVRREFSVEDEIAGARLADLLRRARLDGLEEAPPLSLSLGEQRRLTVATALSRGPNLLLLDEPFIGQDRENVVWILSQILAARERGAVTLLVSHDIPLVASLCDRLLYLGEEAVEGETAEVFDHLESTRREAFTPGYWEGGLR